MDLEAAAALADAGAAVALAGVLLQSVGQHLGATGSLLRLRCESRGHADHVGPVAFPQLQGRGVGVDQGGGIGPAVVGEHRGVGSEQQLRSLEAIVRGAASK